MVYADVMDNYCWQNSMYDAYQAPQKSEVYQSKIGPWSIPPPLRKSQEMIYNFTGLGGKVRAIMRERPDMRINERYDLAYATMRLAFEHIMSRVIMALENDEELLANPPQSLVISGGVASNRFLRTVVTSTLQARGFGNMTVTAPKPKFCTDNAAMVAWAGLKMYEAGWTTDKSFLPQGEWPIEEIIMGVDCWLRNSVAASPESTSKTAGSQRDEAQLPDKPKPQDPPLPSTADAPAEPDAVAAPNASAAHRRKTNAKSATPTEDEVSGSKSKSDNKKPSARPDPGPSSAQDGQHARDGEGPVAIRKVPDNPIEQLKQAEMQLMGPMARRSGRPLMWPRPSLGLRDPNETRPVDGRVAKPDSDKRPAGERDSAKKRVTDGARRDPAKEKMGTAVGSELAAKAQPATPDKPQGTPSATAPGEKKRENDGAMRVPWRANKVQTEGKEKVKVREEEEKKEKRVVRLLPPAPAEKQAPERSLREGLNRLRRWMGLPR